MRPMKTVHTQLLRGEIVIFLHASCKQRWSENVKAATLWRCSQLMEKNDMVLLG
jgi:hypothetical protein